jgi:capsular polysaccharide biosynthesis protein
LVQLIDFPPGTRLADFVSPAFSMNSPALRHADLIPVEILHAMAPTWNVRHFQERRVSVFLAENVYVAEEGLVFNAVGQLFSGTITQHSPAEIERGHAAVRAAIDRMVPPVPGCFVLCKKRGAMNYGHWLMEMLPNAALVRRYAEQIDCRYIVPAAQGQLSDVIRESASLLHIGGDAIHYSDARPLHVERLLIVHGLTNHGTYMSPLVVSSLEALAEPIDGSGHRKLYVTRKGLPSRRFGNETEIEDRAAAHGFTLFDPSGLSFTQQVAAFKNARHIVGVMGAALSNTVFARRGAKIVNLAPASMPDTFFWFIAGLKDHDYLEVRCRQVGPIKGVAAWDTDLWLDPRDLEAIFADDPHDQPQGAA